MTSNTAIVGVDFSTHGEAALDWGIQHAEQFGWQLEVVHAWSYPWWAATPFGTAEAEAKDEVVSSARRHLAAWLQRHLPEGVAAPRQSVVEGDASVVLSEEAADAAAIVIGSGGRRAATAWLTGAVGRRLAAASPVPVVIVPDDREADPARPIAVGVDGSSNSINALRWAVEHAQAGQPVRAVTTWTSSAAHLVGVVVSDLELMETSARQQLGSALEKAAADGLDVSAVESVVAYGDPRTVLREMEDDAAMVVVGSRGSSGVAGVLVGSVTSSLVHRPGCPLVVVPA